VPAAGSDEDTDISPAAAGACLSARTLDRWARKSKDDDCEKDLGKLTEQEDGNNLTRMVVESLKHEK
jgi:hypothetical protein